MNFCIYLNNCTSMRDISFFASSYERWHSVPVISIHLPFVGRLFRANNLVIAVALAIAILRGSHLSNHSNRRRVNNALSGFRKSVFLFWNTQTLERINIKWRLYTNRRNDTKEEISHLREIYTNRLPAAWRSVSNGKTTAVWVSALFFLLVVCNSFGLVPLQSAITGRAGFTLGLSISLLLAITYLGIRRQGTKFVRLFLPSGPSWPIAPLFILLESISYRFRAISLGTRLYCNLFRGHLLLHLFTSLCLVPILALPILIGRPIAIVVVLVLMRLSALETIVAILQSGVFCLLTSFYLFEVLSKKDTLRNLFFLVTFEISLFFLQVVFLFSRSI